jgi:hypothetical protein
VGARQVRISQNNYLLCFVLMPFGTKTDKAGRVTNFDSVYRRGSCARRRAGRPRKVRPTEQIGGTIRKQDVRASDAVPLRTADITGANPNVSLWLAAALRPWCTCCSSKVLSFRSTSRSWRIA